MSLIIPFSDSSAHATGGAFAATTANYPALKYFWKFDSTAAALTDVIGGMIVNGAGNLANTDNGDGTLTLGEAKNVISSGAWTAPGTKSVLMLSVAKPNANQGTILVGSITTGGFRNAAAADTSNGIVCDQVPTAINVPTSGAGSGLAGTASQIQARVAAYDLGSATGGKSWDYDGTTWTDRTGAPVDLSTITTITSVAAAVSLGSTTTRPALAQIWYFTTLPSAAEIKAATIWTMAMITNSPTGTPQKLVYPGFKGLV